MAGHNGHPPAVKKSRSLCRAVSGQEVSVSADLVSRARELRHGLALLDPALMSGEDCRLLAEELALTTKACAAAGARAATRAASCGAHRQAGFRDADQWLARASGTTATEAAGAIEVANSLENCPATKAALVNGSLSLTQAREITRTEAARPGSEAELARLATTSDLKTLRDAARKRRLESFDVNDLHARQHNAREFRHWIDDLGMVRIGGALPPEVGVPFVNRLDAETDRIRRQSRREGSTANYAAHAADAFAGVVEGKADTGAGRTDLVLVCDYQAWLRGHGHRGRGVQDRRWRPDSRRSGPRAVQGCVPQGRDPRRDTHRHRGPLRPPHPRRAAHGPGAGRGP